MTVLSVIICLLAELVMTSASMNYSAQCDDLDYKMHVIQGEALHYCQNLDCNKMLNNSGIVWFRITTLDNTIQPITTEENERVHYHENVLYFLPLHMDDTGCYIAQWPYGVSTYEIQTRIEVYEKFYPIQVYGNFTEQIDIVNLDCPVCNLRTLQNKTLTWYKNFHLIPEKFGDKHQVYLPSEDKGIYTCMCTWEHHGQMYNTSGSYWLQRNEKTVKIAQITFQYPTNNTVVIVELGTEVKQNCLVFFGTNVYNEPLFEVSWTRNGSKINSSQRMVDGGTLSSFTITQVSETDLQEEYCCIAQNQVEWELVCITLKAKESLLPVVESFLCTLIFLLLAAGVVKWFTVDLVLFFRSFKIMQCRKDDGKVFDAYVIYQRDNIDKQTGRKIAHFVNKILPAVLEDSCGFKLYIHGRDDLPGEDCTELIETRMQLSRRLIAVLPPGDCQQGTSTSLCYDWHVGLHQVLVEQELRVIPIQLEDMKEYSHLPLGLQHLLQKTPPVRWDEGSDQATCPTSRFWKHVRYMMPVPRDSSSQDV